MGSPRLYGTGMTFDPFSLVWVMYISAWLLGFIIAMLLLYMVIRLAVTHGMKSHTRWVDEGKQ